MCEATMQASHLAAKVDARPSNRRWIDDQLTLAICMPFEVRQPAPEPDSTGDARSFEGACSVVGKGKWPLALN